MNEFQRDIEAGKAILRSQGINFTNFKERVKACLEGEREADEDHWVYLYNCYASGVTHYKLEVEEWAQFHFQEFTIEEHGYQLKKH